MKNNLFKNGLRLPHDQIKFSNLIKFKWRQWIFSLKMIGLFHINHRNV